MDTGQLERLRQEISETQQRRHKLDLLKITFVTALFGFGAVKIGEILNFYQTLYLIPLIAVFFDLLIMGEHFSIRRLGAFLRLHSKSPLEIEWEKFVSNNRDSFFKNGSRGFTVLSFVAAIALLRKANGMMVWQEWLWFAAIFLAFITIIIRGSLLLEELDKKTEKAQPNT